MELVDHDYLCMFKLKKGNGTLRLHLWIGFIMIPEVRSGLKHQKNLAFGGK